MVRASGDIDVHIVTHEQAAVRRSLPARTGGLTRRRRLAGLALAATALPALTAVLTQLRGTLNLSSDLLAFLLAVVAVALVGGLYPALLAAVAGTLVLNWYFTPPLHTFTISGDNNVLALVVFVAVAVATSSAVDLAARRSRQAARSAAESASLATLAGSMLHGAVGLPVLLEKVRETLGMSAAALLERDPEVAGRWTVLAQAGTGDCTRPADADVVVPAGERHALVLAGRPLEAADRRLAAAFAAQTVAALDHQRLADAVEAAKPLAEADRMRTALLAAVGHDLRTPLAAARAAVAGLRDRDVAWTAEDRAELLDTAAESLDRLGRLVDNLLDMSRLQAGALSIRTQPVGLEDVVPRALDELGPAARAVQLDIPDTLPPVSVDPALLERVVANLTANALRHSPGGIPPRLAASLLADRVELRVVDRGPGIPTADWDRVFTPFQRLGDTDNTTGVGLGLALSRGLTEAMGGTLAPEETPGGGLTMVVSLPAVLAAVPAPEPA